MEEQQETTQQSQQSKVIQQRGDLSPAVPYQLMTTAEKAKYAAIAGVPSFLLLEVLHAGGAGFALAGLLGYGAWHFSDRIREMLPDRTENGAGQPRSLPQSVQNALYWLGTGHAMPASEDQGEQGTVETTLAEDEEQEEMLHLGITLSVHPDLVLSNRVNILGMPGAGKSNTVAVFAEELGQYDAPLVMFDQKPEYTKLCTRRYFLRPFRASVENVTPASAFEFGKRVMSERLQVVLDLASYQNDDDAARVMIGIIRGAWKWEAELENKYRIPCTFFLEEADYWLPQAEQHSHVSRKKNDAGQSLFNHLQQAFFDLVHRGRSFGLGIIVSTQRPANVDNRAIAVAEWRFLLKSTMPADLKVYKEMGLDPDAAMVLGKGEAYVIGPGIMGTFQIRLRKSPDIAQTPGLSNLKRQPAADTSNIRQLRPDQKPSEGQNNGRNEQAVTGNESSEFELEEGNDTPLRYGRNGDTESAPDEAVSAQNEAVTAVNLPPGWDLEKLELLPKFYKVMGLDKALLGLELSTSQRNRDFARDALKQQGLWKEAK
jgi:hypothetical protein